MLKPVLKIFFLLTILLIVGCSGSTRGYSSEEIHEVSASGDYDAMIDALNAGVEECAAVKDEYLEGDMADKEAKRRIKEITERYEPILDKLADADAKGELTYNQHKDLVDITAQAFNHALDGVNKVLDDAGLSVDDIDNSDY